MPRLFQPKCVLLTTNVSHPHAIRVKSAELTFRQIDTAKIHLAEDPEAIEFRLDVVFSAGRWCRFQRERGHWLEAYFSGFRSSHKTYSNTP